MIAKKLKAVWELLRLEHGLMYAAGVLAGIVVSSGLNFSWEKGTLGMLSAIFLQASGFALNDYVDYEVDTANERFDRPLVRGELSRRLALTLSILLAPFGLLSAYLINFKAFLFALFVSLLGYAYDLKLKETGIAGNIYIAFSMAVPFLFGSVVARDELCGTVVVLSSIAFLSGVGREIMKGIEDVRGDAIREVKTVARVFGIRRAAKVAATLYVISVAMSVLPPLLFRRFANPGYAPVLLTDIILLQCSVELLKIEKDEEKAAKVVRKLRKRTLIALTFGLLGFVLAALF